MKKLALAFLAAAVAAPLASFVLPMTAAQAFNVSGGGDYTNSRGHRVRSPVRANRPPAGASARCRDGTYSFSESRRGTCSHHGGVGQWL